MRRSLTVLLTLSLTVPSFAAESQESLDPGVLAPGTRVRVKTYGRDRLPGMPGRLVGRIATADREALTLDLNANQRVSVPVRAIERVEVSAGRHSRWRGALIGAGIGALLVGGISGIALATSDDDSWEEVGAGVGLVYVTPLAALAVGAVGALASPGERWENVPRERLRVTAGPIFRRDGVGVGLSVSF